MDIKSPCRGAQRAPLYWAHSVRPLPQKGRPRPSPIRFFKRPSLHAPSVSV
jgi:hypothetical protein